MKNVLIYYNFSHPLGGGDILPLSFAEELQKNNHVTLAVDSIAGFERSEKAFGFALDAKRVSVVQVMPAGYRWDKHSVFFSFRRSRKLKALAKKADVCISAVNIIDFGRPAHHFINFLSGVDRACVNAVANGGKTALPFVARVKRFVGNCLIRPLVGMRSKRAIILDKREHVYPNSLYAKAQLESFYGAFDGRVFYPPTLFEPGITDVGRKALRVICLGRINACKCITDVILAVEQARDISGRDIELVVAGPCNPNDAYVKRLEQMAKTCAWLFLKDGVFGREKEELLLSGTYAVHARRDEEFGISVTEYLKAGLIPIVPNEGGSCEVVDNPALTYGTNKEAAQILARLITDGAFCDEQRRRCMERARAFSRDAYLARQKELLSDIVSGGAACGAGQ